MKSFKEISSDPSLNIPLPDESVSLSLKEGKHRLALKFNTKDVVTEATYQGPMDPWLSTLCSISIGKSLNELLHLSWKNWEEVFKDDQTFWDLKHEEESDFFIKHLELLKACLDIHRGREFLYQEQSPLVCRCFGIRESDVLSQPKVTTKAGMGCRSCIPQLNRLLAINQPHQKRFYHEKSIADWLLEIDEVLKTFPESTDWKMEIKSFKKNQVIIGFDKEVSQVEEEAMGKKLQGFLSSFFKTGLAFFLVRARQRS